MSLPLGSADPSCPLQVRWARAVCGFPVGSRCTGIHGSSRPAAEWANQNQSGYSTNLSSSLVRHGPRCLGVTRATCAEIFSVSCGAAIWEGSGFPGQLSVRVFLLLQRAHTSPGASSISHLSSPGVTTWLADGRDGRHPGSRKPRMRDDYADGVPAKLEWQMDDSRQASSRSAVFATLVSYLPLSCKRAIREIQACQALLYVC